MQFGEKSLDFILFLFSPALELFLLFEIIDARRWRLVDGCQGEQSSLACCRRLILYNPLILPWLN